MSAMVLKAGIPALNHAPVGVTKDREREREQTPNGADSVESTAMLDRRAQILLKTLVERYIAEGEPVGSRSLSRYSGLDLSPATIRNVMADLEELGFVASPHTSAGRIPTSRGYRFFVDTLLTVKQLDRVEISQLEVNLNPDHPQRLIGAASQLLSELTHFAGVVVASKRKTPAFRHIEFLALPDKRVERVCPTARETRCGGTRASCACSPRRHRRSG